jgi:hypothetical protein
VYKHFNWGPFIEKHELSTYLCDELKKRGNICRDNEMYAHKKLAGHFETEYFFNGEDIDWFVKNTQDIFIDYFTNRKKLNWFPKEDETNNEIKKIVLNPMWINYMKNGDFNPIHGHFGADLSFVLFLDVPEELIKENEKNKNNDTHGGPGTLIFLYGEISNWTQSSNVVFPKKGDMYIFPANVRHMVYPFKSNVERVSVSGNLKYI